MIRQIAQVIVVEPSQIIKISGDLAKNVSTPNPTQLEKEEPLAF
jgi:hypothetical protein